MRNATIRLLLTAALISASPGFAEPQVIGLGDESAAVPSTPEEWVTACGALAGSTYDAGRQGMGVLDDKDLFLGAAQSTCEEAVRQSPDSAEAATWLGRVYRLIGRAGEAVPLLQQGADAGSPFAMMLLSELLIDPYRYDVDSSSDYEGGIAMREQAAATGFAPAQVMLAHAYEYSEQIEENRGEAFRLYALAADQKHPYALFKLGVDAHSGITREQNFAEAMNWYQAAADRNSADGMNGIAQLYEFGQGTAQDYARAAEYHRKAADRGNAASQAELGYFYERGLGVETDPVQAVGWYEKAAGQGNAYAQGSLALQYLFGPGVPVDVDKGLALAQSSAMLGSSFGASILGILYAEGMGTDRDLNTALYYYRDAADNGDTYSQGRIPVIEAELACAQQAGSPWETGLSQDGRELEAIDAETAIAACENALTQNPESIGDKAWLARAYLAAGDESRSAPLMQQAASAGNVLAVSMAADLAFERSTDPTILANAFAALDVPANEKDFMPALYSLARAYEFGLGTEPDMSKAIALYRRAAEFAYPSAASRLAELGSNEGEAIATAANGFGRELAAPF
ncbi:MAG: hypothetical protein ABL879_05480 [Devosia sp.]